MPVTCLQLKKNTGLTWRLRSDKKDASSPISFFNFLSFSSFCYRRGLGERLTIHAITCQENQNKIHKLQINELGVLMTTQEQVDRSVFLCITWLFSCFWRRFCFSCCFSWESSHNLNTPIYLHDLLRFSIIDCYSDIDDPINRWSQTLRTNMNECSCEGLSNVLHTRGETNSKICGNSMS